MEKLTSLSDVEKFQLVNFHRLELSVLFLSYLCTSAHMQQESLNAMQDKQKTKWQLNLRLFQVILISLSAEKSLTWINLV